MADVQELTDLLKRRLREYGYTPQDDSAGADLGVVAVIGTKRRWMVRYLCAVVEVPNPTHDVKGMKQLFACIRAKLTSKYARFPWWKELGSFLVVLCGHELYVKLQGREKLFKDYTGLHMNVMLGTVFVDKETLESSAASTWGLFISGKHDGAIRAAVAEWCERHKRGRVD